MILQLFVIKWLYDIIWYMVIWYDINGDFMVINHLVMEY